MDFLLHESHLFRVFVEDKSYRSLIEYGMIVFKRSPKYCLRIVCKDPRMKKIKLLQRMQEKEKEEETLGK